MNTLFTQYTPIYNAFTLHESWKKLMSKGLINYRNQLITVHKEL